MDWNRVITIAQIVVSVTVIGAILLQNRGEGLGGLFGGGGEVFRTRRGIENTLHYITIALVIILVGLSLLNTYIS